MKHTLALAVGLCVLGLCLGVGLSALPLSPVSALLVGVLIIVCAFLGAAAIVFIMKEHR